MSNLGLRIASALVMAPAALYLTWLGGLPFRILAVLIGAAIFYEWSHMAGLDRNRPAFALLMVLVAVPLVMLLAGAPAISILLAVVPCFLLALAVGSFVGQPGWAASGLLYAALPVVAMATLRGADAAGLAAILFLFAVVWATDIFAYFVGRAAGGPKLAPSISPGKTWSGAMGGAFFGTLAGLGAAWGAGAGPGLVFALAAFALSVVSQCGDLFESWVKRRHGAKDSSHIIPGHGGVMDRVDGLVAAAIALYVIGWLASGAENPAGLFGL